MIDILLIDIFFMLRYSARVQHTNDVLEKHKGWRIIK